MAGRLLIAYSMTASHVQTTLDYLLMLKEHLGFETDYVHTTHDAIMDFDLSRYDVVFNNYCVRHCFESYVAPDFRRAMREFRGLKIMAVQDEYDHTDRLKAAIKDLGFHIVLTCVPQESLEYVYPRAEFPGVEFITVFTGYVPDTLAARSASVKPLTERPIVVGYRGRDIGGRYGRLGFDKFEIGRRMKVECDKRGVGNDIAMDENSRIYGPAWFDFIENCRAMLGTESGSNVFDFDGSLDAKFKELSATLGHPPSYQEFAPFVADREGHISMGQISPRVFECAALRTPMLLYRGCYSGAIEPDAHYIALEKDFSNIDAVLERLRDLEGLRAMTDRAHAHLIASGEFTYKAFAARLRERIDARLAELLAERAAAAATPPRELTDAAERVLAEQPTAHPLKLDDFYAKQQRLAVARAPPVSEVIDQVKAALTQGQTNRRAAMAALFALRHRVPRSVAVWRLVPVSVRTRFLSRLKSRMS